MMMEKTPQKASKKVGYSGEKPEHKVILMKAYWSNNTWLLKVKKEDAEWLGLEPFETFEIRFHKKGANSRS